MRAWIGRFARDSAQKDSIMKEAHLIQDDEIDLLELWRVLVKHKMTIVVVAVITTLCAAIYVLITKPTYKGEVLIEVGEAIFNSEPINDKPTFIEPIEKKEDLQWVIEQAFNTNPKEEKINIDFPKGSGKLIRVGYEHTDKKIIHQKLEEVAAFILSRHQQNSEFFQKAHANIHHSRVVGTIHISTDPIKPKKFLIITVALVTGVILGIFLAFFRDFIQNQSINK